MSRRIPIFYSALMLTGVNLLLRFVGTSFQVYLSGKIGASGIGLVQLVMSVGSLAMVAAMGGIRTGTMYLTAEELGKNRPQNIGSILSGCFLYSILFSVSVSVLLYIAAPWIAEYWIRDMRTVGTLRLYCALLPCVCLCGVMTGYFTGANRIGTLAGIEVAEQLITMVITLTALNLWAGSNPSRACLCVILGSGCGACLTLVCLVILRLREKGPEGKPIPVRKRLCATALPLAVADDLRTGISTAENLMVPTRLSLCTHVADPLAAFGTVSGMVFPVMMFPACILFGLAELLIPELARCSAAGSTRRISHLVRKSLKTAMIYGSYFSGLIFLLAQDLCQKLYSSQEAGQYLRLYALMIPMLYCDSITDAMIKGLGQQRISVRYNILTNILDILLLYFLLPRYGMYGYFVSFLLTHLLNFGLSLRRLLIICRERISLMQPLLGMIAMVPSVLIASMTGSPAGRITAYTGILTSLLFLFGIADRNDVKWLRGQIRRT